MAPAKTGASNLKRKEAARPAPAAKKAKRNPDPWKNISDAINTADVSEETKSLILQVLPCSLGEFADKRHKYQEQVVEAIRNVLKDIEGGLAVEVSKAQSERVDAENKISSLDNKSEEAMKTLGEQKSRVQEFKKCLAADTHAFRDAKKSLEETQEEKSKAEFEVCVSRNKKEEYVAMMGQLEFLKDASPEDAESQKKNASLLAMVKKHGFEDSMLIALPASLKKAKEARGQFDNLTIDGLEIELKKRIAEMDAAINAFAPTEEKHLAAVAKACGILDADSAKLRASAKSFQAAADDESACTVTAADATKAVRDLANSLKRLGKVCNNTEAELEVFRAGPLETFQTLREQVEPKPTVPEQQEPQVEVETAEPKMAEPMAVEVA